MFSSRLIVRDGYLRATSEGPDLPGTFVPAWKRNPLGRLEDGADPPGHADAPPVAGDDVNRRQALELLDRGGAEGELGLAGPDLRALPVVALHRDELVHRGRPPLLDAREVAVVEHRQGVHEPAPLGRAGDREPGVDHAPVVHGDARPEPSTGPEPRPRLAERDRPGHPDRAEPLGIALVPTPGHREVPVDPDQQAPRVELTPVRATDDDERLLVLGAHGVQELLERVRARLT